MLDFILSFGGIIAAVFSLIAISSISRVRREVKNLYIEDESSSFGEDNGKFSKITDILETLQSVSENNGIYDKHLMSEMVEQYNGLFLIVRNEEVLQTYAAIIDFYEKNAHLNVVFYNRLIELFRGELGLPKINLKKQKTYLNFSHKIKNVTKTKKKEKIDPEMIIEEDLDATKTSKIVKAEVIESIKEEKGLKSKVVIKKIKSGGVPKRRVKKD